MVVARLNPEEREADVLRKSFVCACHWPNYIPLCIVNPEIFVLSIGQLHLQKFFVHRILFSNALTIEFGNYDYLKY